MLIYEDEAWYDAVKEDWQKALEDHGRFTQQVVEMGGKILGGEALQPTATATTVRGDVVTDGPFVETKEALGGFYVVEAADLDQALAIAKLCPAGGGGVEVRPVLDVSGGPEGVQRG
ncbi:MAG: YciI family protein [Streptosporangiaceae bacterium]